jgi:hypothetical protein
MDLLAHNDDDYDIDKRIQCLIYAVNSATMACRDNQHDGSRKSSTVIYTYDKLEDLKGKLEIACKSIS